MEKYLRYGQNNDKIDNTREFQIQPHHIQFQTNDSEASDSSYQSSLSSNEENNLGSAEYFREEMSRFFINYPELLNQELVGSQTNEKSLWGDLASDIMNEAKEQPISLQGIAKRIAFYRQKTEQIDIIDLIVKEKDLILKELDEEAKMPTQDSINPKVEDSNGKRVNTLGQTNENIYYSWKKRHEASLINDSRKNTATKAQSSSLHSHTLSLNLSGKQKKFTSLKKNQPPKQPLNQKWLNRSKNSSIHSNFMPNATKDGKNGNQKLNLSKMEENGKDMRATLNQQSASPQLKNILKFEPKTEIAKQLLDEIKKHQPNDEIGIKRTIVNFLVRHRESMKKNILSKSSLNQRLSKLHIEDSKQLLLFCPLKKNSVETDMPLNTETNSFLQILNEISTGHLMKYWKLLQERKL